MKKTSFYNQEYFQARDHLDLHLAESLKILIQDRGLKKILDVGCGTGQLVAFLNKNGFEAFGCDNTQEAIKQARKINSPQAIIQASATELPFKNNSFDLVTAVSLIEHLEGKEPQDFIKESYRILKPGCFIFLITPNFDSPFRFIFGKKWFGFSDPTHVQFFTPRSLATLLKTQGFSNIKFRHKTAYNLPTNLHLPQFCRPLPKGLKNLLNYLMISSPLSTFRDSLWILAQK